MNFPHLLLNISFYVIFLKDYYLLYTLCDEIGFKKVCC